MQRSSVHLCVHAIAVTALAIAGSGAALADGVLHAFKGSPDGGFPVAPLVTDANGNLFGTTYSGGTVNDIGTVFELSPNGSGGYTYSQIYAFHGVGDGQRPTGALVLDSAGNLYGTTMYGGSSGVGAVFEVSPVAGGGWSEKVIYSFQFETGDGFYAGSGLVRDAFGNLYGVTQNGGTHGVGTVFKLARNSSGVWTEAVIYSFTGSVNSGPDGAGPLGGLVFDPSGNLYGTTYLGGRHLDGTVFQLSPAPDGTWTERVIHAFNGSDGCNPQSSLALDTQGNLYGTTDNQRPSCQGWGTIFKLTPLAGGWGETVLHRFQAPGDGNYPSGVTVDGAGDIYGTAWIGGLNTYGTIFKLSANSNGVWTEKAVHSFTNGPDGSQPLGGVIIGIDGNLYGTARVGGAKGAGVVFQNKP